MSIQNRHRSDGSKMRLSTTEMLRLTTVLLVLGLVQSFTASSLNKHHGRFATKLGVYGRRGVRLPLLDLSESEYANGVVVPLPSSHLPNELTTINLYGMTIERPVHKMLIEEAIASGDDLDIGAAGAARERGYGHVTGKPNEDDLVGAVGCVAEVLMEASDGTQTPESVRQQSDIGQDPPVVVLSRGCYRFVVREVKKTFPYPVAIVDELVDEAASEDTSAMVGEAYQSLQPSELLPRIMQGVKTLLDQERAEQAKAKSPLETSILQASGVPPPEVSQLEEMVAVFDVFSASLIDLCPTPLERNFAVGMMAAELANVNNEVRKQIVSTTDGVRRLRIVCEQLEEKVGMNQARKVANQITDSQDESSKDLQVGPPTLPPWAAQIRKGVRVDYYWNDEFEWCSGTVVEEPLKIMDEMVVTVEFDADGERHRLPLNPDEKVRWRPGPPPP